MKILFILIFFCFPLMASTKKYSPIKELPYELGLLVESVQDLLKEKKEKEEFLKKLKHLDKHLSSLTKEEAFFLSKSEIYFDLLRRNRGTFEISTELLSERTIDNFEKIITKNQDQYTKYTLWLAKAIKNDLEQLFSSSEFPLYVSRIKNKKRISSSKNRVIHKKVKLLLPWYQIFVENTPDQLKSEMKNIFTEQINVIIESSENLIYFSRFNKMDPKNIKNHKLKFFELKESTEVSDKNLTDVEIIESIEVPENKPLVQAKAWIPKDGPPKVLFPKPDPEYKAPDALPEPVDDWILEIQ